MTRRCWHEQFFIVIFLVSGLGLGQVAKLHSQGLERVKVGYSVGGIIPFPLIVAKDKKIFEQEGLEVELINIRPGLAVTALVSGDLQYTNFAGTSINAAAQGLPIKVVMVYNDRPLFSIVARPQIQSLRELKGKVLGVSSLASGESFLSRRILRQVGIDVDREMTLRVIGNTPERLAALRTGTVDATTLTVPVDLQSEKFGLRRLVFAGDAVEAVSGGLGASDRWIKERPDQVKKFLQAVLHAMVYAKTHRQEAISMVMSRWQLERDIAEKVFDLTVKSWAGQGVASDSAVLISIQGAQELLKGKKEVPISQVVDFSLVRQAFAELKQK